MIDVKKKTADMCDKLLHTPLPPALQKLKFKRIALGMLTIVVTAMAVLITRNAAALMLILLAAFFVGSGLKLNYDYAEGKIYEFERLCLSSLQKGRGRYDITFEDENQDTQVFTCNTRKDDFFIDVKYRFYTAVSAPKVIIAYEAI